MPTPPRGDPTSPAAAPAATTFPKVEAAPFEFPLHGNGFEVASTCLLVIDLQRDFTEKGGYMDAMGYDVTPLSAPLPHVAAVLSACRSVGMTIVHTRQGFREDLADLTPFLRKKFERSGVTIGADGPLGRIFVRGQPGWEINTSVCPMPGEPIIDKTANSAFVGTDLDAVLRGAGIDELIVCGNTLDCCVHSTLRSANDMNYQTLLLSDCCGCVEAEVPGLRAAMIASVGVEGGLFGTVCESAALLAALGQ